MNVREDGTSGDRIGHAAVSAYVTVGIVLRSRTVSLPPQVGRKRGQRFPADVVLDAFGVRLRDGRRDPDRDQKSENGLVPGAGLLRETSARGGEKNGSIRLARDQAFALQPLDRAIGRDVGHAQTARQIDQSGLPGLVDQLGDHLHVAM